MFVITRPTVAPQCDLQISAVPTPLHAARSVAFRDLPMGARMRLGLERTVFRYGLLSGLACALLLLAPRHPAILSLTPIALFMAIVATEGYALRRSPEARRARVSEAVAVAQLQRFSKRAKTALHRIAARHETARGVLTLVVERSPLDRLSPVTVMSVQCDVPDARVLDLTAADRLDLVCLFDHALTEADLAGALARDDRPYLTVAVPGKSRGHPRLSHGRFRNGARPDEAAARHLQRPVHHAPPHDAG